MNGRSVYEVRKRMGRELARECAGRRRRGRFRCRIPACRRPSASRRACGIPYELGIIRNHYVGRTFIQPTQSVRELGVRLKHSANRAAMAGKRIVLVDDSLVRGTTSVKIVRMMREAGAKEVHFRIACPPITHPDFYGIDTPEKEKLLAATHDLEEMRAVYRRRFARLPLDRRALPRHGRGSAATRRSRNSPTIASPATTRRR